MNERHRIVVVSACLAGIPCRYDKTAKKNDDIIGMVERGEAVAACPECMAGLKSPRPPAEIQGGDGAAVLDGRATVNNKEGIDITAALVEGAQKFLEFVRARGAERVILKAKSPSCGVTEIYDGSFTGKRIPGCGVAAALLLRNGIRVEEV